MKETTKVDFYFDYVDPGSYVIDVMLRRLLPEEGAVARHPLELRPPPRELLDAHSPEWSSYLDTTRAIATDLDIELASVDFMPWTRKAHELRMHASEKGLEQPLHEAIFDARFRDGADIGRVDVLVGLAVQQGLDLTEAKAVLDVDRFADAVASERERAESRGITHTPTLQIGSESLEGPLRIDELEGLLRAAHVI